MVEYPRRLAGGVMPIVPHVSPGRCVQAISFLPWFCARPERRLRVALHFVGFTNLAAAFRVVTIATTGDVCGGHHGIARSAEWARPVGRAPRTMNFTLQAKETG